MYYIRPCKIDLLVSGFNDIYLMEFKLLIFLHFLVAVSDAQFSRK